MRGRAQKLWMSCLLTACAAMGCADDLPDPALIVTTRPLAIKTTVIDSLFAPEAEDVAPRAQALPFDTVEIEPFVVTPEGPIAPEDLEEEIAPIWIACELGPNQGVFACLETSLPLDFDEIPECEAPDPSELANTDGAPTVESPCIIGRDGVQEYVVPFTANTLIGGSVEITMIAQGGETPTQRCAEELLSGDSELPNDCIFAAQQLTLGPLEELASALEAFGSPLPPGAAPTDDEEFVTEADRHPRIREFGVREVDDRDEAIEGPGGDPEEIERGDVVGVELGKGLRIDTVAPESDLQTFYVPVNNGESFEMRTEAYQGQWFVTWGQLIGPTSNDPASFNGWLFSPGSQDKDDVPEGGRAHLYYVVRDGRRGVDWYWFSIRIDE